MNPLAVERPARSAVDGLLPSLSEAVIVRLDDPLDVVSERLGGRGAMVLDDGRLVGSISPAHVARWLQAHRR